MLLAALLALPSGLARADELVAAAPPSDELHLLHRGVALALDFESGAFGLASTAEVGFELKVLRTTRGKELLWLGELLAGPAGGGVANTYSPSAVLGARATGDGELDYRFRAERTWSPYLGGGGNLQLQALAVPALGLGGYDRVNSLDGIAGVNGAAGLRAAGGMSGLAARAWQLGLFVQEEFRAPTHLSTGNFFSEAGVHLRCAASRGLWLTAEALIGRTRSDTDPLLQRTTHVTHQEASLSVRQELGRIWLALDARVAQDREAAAYSGSTVAFDTAGPVTFAAVLGAGMVLP